MDGSLFRSPCSLSPKTQLNNVFFKMYASTVYSQVIAQNLGFATSFLMNHSLSKIINHKTDVIRILKNIRSSTIEQFLLTTHLKANILVRQVTGAFNNFILHGSTMILRFRTFLVVLKFIGDAPLSSYQTNMSAEKRFKRILKR